MNLQSNQNVQLAVRRGIINRDNTKAFVERARAYEQYFGEFPKVNVSEGALPGHEQIELGFFSRDNSVEMILDLNEGFLDLRNTCNNNISSVTFETRYGLVDVEHGGKRSLAIEQFVVNAEDAKNHPHLADKLSKIRVVDNSGNSIEDLKSELKSFDPTAIWVEQSKANEHFLLQEVIGHGKDREKFINEFESQTGPRQTVVRVRSFEDDSGMSP